jgi:hypothetical protein
MIAFRVVHFFSHNEITTRILDDKGQSLVLTLSEMYRKSFIRDIKI